MHDAMPKPPPRICVAFCSHDRVHAGWAYDLMHTLCYFVSTGGRVGDHKFSIGLSRCETSLLAEGRQRVIEDAKRKGAAKIFLTDTDMRLPKETLHMLLRHDEPIVGCNYVSRRPPFRFTAATLDNEQLVTKPDSTGLVEVGHIGFGCVLIDMSVFAEDDGPWFAFDWYQNEKKEWKQIGEDVFFCRLMRERGHKIYVDQELSAVLGHTGEFQYTPEVMLQVDAIAEANASVEEKAEAVSAGA